MKYEVHVLAEKLFRLRLRVNELNASSNRPEARIRRPFEYLEILKNYKSLTDPEDLVKVFPIAERYVKPEGFDAGFILGMAALQANTHNFTKLFGLELLFEAVNDPERARRIKSLYGFGHSAFVALTTQHDVFSSELAASFQNQLNMLRAHANALETQVSVKDRQVQLLSQYIEAIHDSRAWKLISTYREIRSKLFRGT
jgi:hypothetical protein